MSTTVPKLNDKLINCVLEHIEHEVQRRSNKYNQNNWAYIDWELVDKAVNEGEDTDIDQTMCGSAACFAGWTCLLSEPLVRWRRMTSTPGFDWFSVGQQKLGLTRDEAYLLFGGTETSSRSAQLRVIKTRLKVIRESRESKTALYKHPEYGDCSK